MARATPRTILALLLTLSVLAVPVYAAPHRVARSMRAQIEALEQQWRAAAMAEDTEAMDHLLSDDFLGITASGQVMTKIQQLDRMRTRTFVITRLDVSDMKIKLISRHAAIVTSLAQIEGSNDGRPLHGSFRYTRVYQRLPTGMWKITSFEATHVPNHDVAANEAAKS
ncbi:MAG TPA: nuclear transport factor 2 family protein [Acidobacteriaceae bacterium]|jgi:ketosteroid isomerase-like protein|nr:nuclear transport factor 2 family protein [Acidobacteriaceae bacterium]